MTHYVVRGGRPLSGSVSISGAKNAAVAIIPATLLIEGKCRVENIPDISDVHDLIDILLGMGAQAHRVGPTTWEFDCSKVRQTRAPFAQARKIRASYYLIGALLGRFGRAEVAMPGGCDFGSRPIDQHIKGWEALGAHVETIGGEVLATAERRLQGSGVYLDMESVGATMNIMIAAVLAEGITVIENAAKEPHVVDLANFLNAMGARVSGAGTDVIKVRGVDRLRGGFYSIIPDQIEAGTYLMAGAATGGTVTVTNVIPKHLDCITAKLREMGCRITEDDDAVRLEAPARLRRTNVKTMPYPGFPTDMQPQIAVCMSLAQGTSIITEGVYDHRFRYVAELHRMGAQAQVDGKVCVVEGVDGLAGAPVKACDLRAGAAMVIAGLAAQGVTVVEDVYHIERGYENIIEKLRNLGADITRVEVPDPTAAVAAG